MRALGHLGAVKSPTFTLVESYSVADRRVHHFDLYRIADPEELEYIGLEDYFDGEAVCIVEWPERGLSALPAADVTLTLSVDGPSREVVVSATSSGGRSILSKIDHSS